MRDRRGSARLGLVITGTLSALAGRTASADQFHYSNVLVGTRAVGMGGAFGAIADDASGVYYNPAGLAFALANDISGSANAFYSKESIYKKTLCDDNFVEASSGSLTPFFGGLQKLDRYVTGLVFAFGVYYVDGDLKDQDTLLEDAKFCPVNADGTNGREVAIKRYHRTSNARSGTYFAGAGAGYRIMPNLAVGFGMSYFNADELVQEYQDVKLASAMNLADGPVAAWQITTVNNREHLVVHGAQPVLGAQLMLPAGVSLGLTLKKAIIASEHFDWRQESRNHKYLASDEDALNSGGGARAEATATTRQEYILDSKSTKPLDSMPMETRLGMAWFVSPKFLLALDAIHYSAATGGEKIGGIDKYKRNAVTNYAAGMEWYLAAAFPLRFGVFTNNDARPKVKKGEVGQGEHVDYLGESLFIAWVQPNSQISGGFILQQGKGESMKTSSLYNISKISSTSTSFAFSATHNL